MEVDTNPTTYASVREWRRAILGDREDDTPPNADALEKAITAWTNEIFESQRILQENEATRCESGRLYSLTFLLATVCDLGRASIDPTPMTDCYQLIAEIRPRQLRKNGDVAPANASDDELQEIHLAVRRAFPVLNRMRHAWVALEGGDPPEEDDLKRRNFTPPGGADVKILGALIALHGYRDGSVKNPGPFAAGEIVALAKVGAGSVTNFWRRRLSGKYPTPDYLAYQSACRTGRIQYFLQLWNGDFSSMDVADEVRDIRNRRPED